MESTANKKSVLSIYNPKEMIMKFKDKEYTKHFIIRFSIMVFGFFLIGLANVMGRNSALGMNSWGAFFVGISDHTPFTLGQVNQLVTLLFILINIFFFRIYPMLGTLCDMIFVGSFIDLIDYTGLVPYPEALWSQTLLCLLSVVVLGFGIGLYMATHLGSGPRDGLMLGLNKTYKIKIRNIRIAMDATALIGGFLLKGPIGLGTVIIVFGLGFVLERTLLAFEYPIKKHNLRYLYCRLEKEMPEEKHFKRKSKTKKETKVVIEDPIPAEEETAPSPSQD